MSFDPYEAWLGIPKDRPRPLSHYDLLGLDLYEDDADKIQSQAQERFNVVQPRASGDRRIVAGRLIGEISAAEACLSDPKLKQQYDAELRSALPGAVTASSHLRDEDVTAILGPPQTPPVRPLGEFARTAKQAPATITPSVGETKDDRGRTRSSERHQTDGFGVRHTGVLGQGVAGKKIAAGICGILIGWLGVHRFLLGDTTGGILRIVISFSTCGIGGYIGLIEGIIYLTKTNEEFYQTYMVEKKEWF